jgi:hypothetical protein
MAAVCRLVSWNRTMPPRACSSRCSTRRSSASGLIGFQSLAHRSAPNTTMRRCASRSSSAGLEAKPGKRKNGVTVRRVFPIQRVVDGRDAAVDLRLRRARRHPVEEGVRPRVVRDRVTFGELAAQDVRMSNRVAAEDEERRSDALGSQRIEDLCGRARPGSVVEGEHDFPAIERQRGGELLAAYLRTRRRVDRKNSARPQRIGRAFGRGRQLEGEEQGNPKACHPGQGRPAAASRDPRPPTSEFRTSYGHGSPLSRGRRRGFCHAISPTITSRKHS